MPENRDRSEGLFAKYPATVGLEIDLPNSGLPYYRKQLSGVHLGGGLIATADHMFDKIVGEDYYNIRCIFREPTNSFSSTNAPIRVLRVPYSDAAILHFKDIPK